VRIDHVQVAAPPGCEQEARAFYGGLCGLEEIEKPEALRARGGVWFALGGGQQLHVGVEQGFAPARKAHPAFAVDDLDGLAARLRDVRWDAALPGVRRFYASDPFGNRLEFVGQPATGWDALRTTILDEGGPVWLWEVRADVENFFPDAAPAECVTIAERLLRELVGDGWAYMDGAKGERLLEAELETQIREGAWRTFPPAPDDDVSLVPTDKWKSWSERAR
jgi:catechol 2,3-dioxygenase-like lactoylglutathione lyase family enzyme